MRDGRYLIFYTFAGETAAAAAPCAEEKVAGTRGRARAAVWGGEKGHPG